MTAEESAAALAFKLVVTKRGCEIHDDTSLCEPPIQAAHLIPQQTLRKEGFSEHLWDPRNGVGACYRAHRRSDAAVERFPVERIPEAAWQFAEELGLTWKLERLYGVSA